MPWQPSSFQPDSGWKPSSFQPDANGFNEAVARQDTMKNALMGGVPQPGLNTPAVADNTQRSFEQARPDYIGMAYGMIPTAFGGAAGALGAPLGPLPAAILAAGGAGYGESLRQDLMRARGAQAPEPGSLDAYKQIGTQAALGGLFEGGNQLLRGGMGWLAKGEAGKTLGVTPSLRAGFPDVDIEQELLDNPTTLKRMTRNVDPNTGQVTVTTPSSDAANARVLASSQKTSKLLDNATKAGYKIRLLDVSQQAIQDAQNNLQELLRRNLTAPEKAQIVSDVRGAIDDALEKQTGKVGASQIPTLVQQQVPGSVLDPYGNPTMKTITVPGPPKSAMGDQLTPNAAKNLKQYFQQQADVQAAYRAEGKGGYDPFDEAKHKALAAGFQSALENLPGGYGGRIAVQESKTQAAIALQRALTEAENRMRPNQLPVEMGLRGVRPFIALSPELHSWLMKFYANPMAQGIVGNTPRWLGGAMQAATTPDLPADSLYVGGR